MSTETIVGVWHFQKGTSVFDAVKVVEMGRHLRIFVVRPKRVDRSTFDREVAREKRLKQTFGHRDVEVVVIDEPDGEPTVHAGRAPGEPTGEAIACLVCEPHPQHGHIFHGPLGGLRGHDVTLVVKRNGAPAQEWQHHVDNMLEDVKRVRVLLVD